MTNSFVKAAHDRLFFVIPGDITTRTGGYAYDRRIMDGLRRLGMQVELVSLDGDFPFPDEAQLVKAERRLAELPDGALTVIDGLAFGVMPAQLGMHAERLQLVALVHHPLALETGISSGVAASLQSAEREALRHAQRAITTSKCTAASLLDYAVPAARIATVQPGTDTAPLAAGSHSGTLQILCVATLTQRKGHAVLLEALAQLAPRDWHLSCAGSARRDEVTAQALVRQCAALGLDGHVSFLGEVDEATLDSLYSQADLFVLASFHEGYGMVLDEAIARGLPIISTDAGALSQTLPPGAGMLVPAGNVDALAGALQRFIEDSTTRMTLKSGAAAARSVQRSWPQAAAEFRTELFRTGLMPEATL